MPHRYASTLSPLTRQTLHPQQYSATKTTCRSKPYGDTQEAHVTLETPFSVSRVMLTSTMLLPSTSEVSWLDSRQENELFLFSKAPSACDYFSSCGKAAGALTWQLTSIQCQPYECMDPHLHLFVRLHMIKSEDFFTLPSNGNQRVVGRFRDQFSASRAATLELFSCPSRQIAGCQIMPFFLSPLPNYSAVQRHVSEATGSVAETRTMIRL
jgi:hypothetical protein